MRRQAAVGLGALLAFALGGCGTMNNLSPPPKKDGDDKATPAPVAKSVYGGVGLDARVGAAWLAAPFVTERPAQVGMVEAAMDSTCKVGIGAWVLAVDLPLSAVADTLTLPVTIPATLKNHSQAEQQTRPRRDKDADDGYDVDAPADAPPQR